MSDLPGVAGNRGGGDDRLGDGARAVGDGQSGGLERTTVSIRCLSRRHEAGG